jgi:ABC-2 type transport system permease protein
VKAYWRLTQAQLLLFLRNKNVVIWSLVVPILMMAVLGTLIKGGNTFRLDVAVVDQDHSSASHEFVQSLKSVRGVSVEMEKDLNQGIAQVKQGDRQLVILIRKGFGRHLNQRTEKVPSKEIVLYLDKSNLTAAQLGTTVVGQMVDQLNKRLIGFRPVITTETVNIQSRTLGYIDFLVPGLLALMIMNNNMNGVAATIASWRERGILRRMQATPLSSATFIAGQITARIVLNGLQALIVLLVAYWVFGVHVYGSWWLLLILILLGTLTFMSIGFIIASLAKTPETAGPMAGLLSFPMIFVGGVFFPLRDLPDWLRPVVDAIPIGHLTHALRSVMNEGAGLSALWTPVAVLTAWMIGSFTVAAWMFRWDAE